MTKREFLKDLENALEGEMDKNHIKSQIDFYDKYINDEIKKGRTEQEVLSELGDARLIAKTIKQVNENNESSEYVNNNQNYNNEYDYSNNNKSKRYIYTNSTNSLGCIIIALIFLIILFYILRLLFYSATWIFMSPAVLLIIIIAFIICLTGKR